MKKISVFLRLYIAVAWVPTLPAASPIAVDEWVRRLGQIQSMEDPKVFSVAVHKRQNELYQELEAEIFEVCTQCMVASRFEEIIPLLDSDNESLHALAVAAVRDFLLDGDGDFSLRRDVLAEVTDYLAAASNSEGWDVVLLQIGSADEFAENRSVMKKLVGDWVLRDQGSLFLLEIVPALYESPEIQAYLETRGRQVDLAAVKSFARSRGKRETDSQRNVLALLLAARHGNEAAYAYYHALAEEAIDQGGRPERILRGIALMGTPEAYDALFRWQSDFRRSEFSRNPIALIVTAILSCTIEGYPFLEANTWVPVACSEETLTPYLEWSRDHKNDYRVKKLSPYEWYRFLAP